MLSTQQIIDKTNELGAHNYHPKDVVIVEADGVMVRDPEGREYFDMLSAYSALNFGHRHPEIIEAAKQQLDKVTLTSRAFHNSVLCDFYEKLCGLTGKEMILPMNTGAEAVETALKTARRWGVEKKGVENGKQEIIVCENNFHGRTIAIISFSTDPDARINYGPYCPGFKIVKYGDAKALEEAITPNTVAFLAEPIQGEAGIIVPPKGYLKEVREICTKHNILFIADEVQTGFARTGRMFACEFEEVVPDMYILGKASEAGRREGQLLHAEAARDRQPRNNGSPRLRTPHRRRVHRQRRALRQEAHRERRTRERDARAHHPLRAADRHHLRADRQSRRRHQKSIHEIRLIRLPFRFLRRGAPERRAPFIFARRARFRGSRAYSARPPHVV